jgi:hypothetical protein
MLRPSRQAFIRGSKTCRQDAGGTVPTKIL